MEILQNNDHLETLSSVGEALSKEKGGKVVEVSKNISSLESEESVQKEVEKNSLLAVKGLKETFGKINDFLKEGATSLHFEVDQDVDKVVIKVVNPKTDEVIRQIPSEEALKVAKNLMQYLEKVQSDSTESAGKGIGGVGLIYDNKA